MNEMEKWGILVDCYNENKTVPEKKIQEDWENLFVEIFGYSKLSKEVDAQRNIQIGATVRTIPDIIIHDKEQGEKAPSDKKDYSPEKLLADAKELAGKDKDLQKRIKSLEKALKSSTRGASGGPLYDYGVSYGNGGVNYHIWFDGGRLAEVFVYSLDGADFDMYIYDDRGNLLCYDERYNWDAYGFWHPRRTGRYTIMIKNRSRYNSAYMMYTN